MGKHSPNEKQIKAFNDVVAAIKKAKTTGLVFYGKCSTLVAYTKKADDYIHEVEFGLGIGTGFRQVECLGATVLKDSGADDYGSYRSENDELKYYGNHEK